MTAYGSPLNEDNTGKPTSAQLGDPGDGSSVWFLPAKVYDGGDVAQGLKADAAVTNPASSATVIALLKGLLKNTRVSQSSPGVSAVGQHQAGANASVVSTLVAGGSGTRTFVTGVHVTGLGATAAGTATLTIAGLAGGSRVYDVNVVAGATTAITPLLVDFTDPVPASADNTPITATLTAFGAGNTSARVNVYGFVRTT